jgi:serine/threonine protein kinase
VIIPLLRVLVKLHADHIVHRDIKPENLFLTRKRKLKLGDFGLAIKIDEELPFMRSGTLDYMSPEVQQQQRNKDPMVACQAGAKRPYSACQRDQL